MPIKYKEGLVNYRDDHYWYIDDIKITQNFCFEIFIQNNWIGVSMHYFEGAFFLEPDQYPFASGVTRARVALSYESDILS